MRGCLYRYGGATLEGIDALVEYVQLMAYLVYALRVRDKCATIAITVSAAKDE